MKPIINPWIFYFISVLDKIQTLGIIFLIISSVACGIFLFSIGDILCDEEEKMVRKWSKISFATLLVSALIVVAVPSKKTMCEMMVANYVTGNNIEAAKDDVKELVDYIVEKFEDEPKEDK